MANGMYVRGLARLANYDWASDTIDIGCLLVGSTYSFDASHNVVSDVAVDEAAGTGYARKNIGSASRSTNEDDAGSAANLRINDGSVVWTGLNAGTDLRIVLFFIDGAGINDDANNNLLGYIDTGTDIPIDSDGTDVTLNFHTDGAIKHL